MTEEQAPGQAPAPCPLATPALEGSFRCGAATKLLPDGHCEKCVSRPGRAKAEEAS